jgi:hypothetical protein
MSPSRRVVPQMTRGARRPFAKRTVLRVSCVGVLSLSAACASTQSPATSKTPPAELATLLYEASHSCQPLAVTNNAAAPAPQLFIETVLLDVPASTRVNVANLSTLANDSDVRLLGTPHIVGKLEERTMSSFEQHLGALARPTLTQLSFIAKTTESALPLLEFELGFAMPNTNPTRNPELARTSFFVEGRADQALLGSADYPGDPQRKVLAVVKVYPIRSQDDLRAHFECKMQLHQQALERL